MLECLAVRFLENLAVSHLSGYFSPILKLSSIWVRFEFPSNCIVFIYLPASFISSISSGVSRHGNWIASIKYCAEFRRLLRDRLIRVFIIILVALLLLYSLSSSTGIQTLSAKSSKSWEHVAFGSPIGIPVLLNHNEGIHPLKPKSTVGKVHAVFGEPYPVYERGLELHQAHADKQGHPMFVLRERILSGLWSKPAFILSVMLQELAKPESERLQWLLWVWHMRIT